MRINTFRFALTAVLPALFLTFTAASNVLADQAPKTSSTYAMLSGVYVDHVFLTDQATGECVDVTNTVYTSQGQTYAAINGRAIAIVLDSQRGNVYDTQGNAIGFIRRELESEASPNTPALVSAF